MMWGGAVATHSGRVFHAGDRVRHIGLNLPAQVIGLAPAPDDDLIVVDLAFCSAPSVPVDRIWVALVDIEHID